MGFGFILIGYMMMVEVGVSTSEIYNIGFEIFPDVIGYVLFFLALKKLRHYSRGFRIAKSLTYILMPLGGIKLIAQAWSFTGLYAQTISRILDGCELSKVVLLSLFNIFLFSGIRELAKEVELPKIVRRSLIALLINLLYFVTRMVVYVAPFTDAQAAFLYYVYNILWYILLFFTFFLVFSCYMYICYEGEEDITVPESKITAFFKRLKK
mgnify:CR=1 FL=1